ncbi:MAG: hypothetical protein KC636_13465, partial [Myxococcales bacterium]|nr:hypothetical protein [Myxococcales bacterium]
MSSNCICTQRARHLALAACLVGCSVGEGRSDSSPKATGVTDTGGGSSSTLDASASSPTDATTDDGTTSASNGTTDATTGEPSSTGVESTGSSTTGEPSGTDDPSDTGESTDTGGAQTCWGGDLHDWVIVQVADADLGQKPADPHISGDGLTLTYIAGDGDVTGGRRPYKAFRVSVDAPFVTGALFAAWDGVPYQAAYPRLVGQEELILTMDDDLRSSLLVGNFWEQPEVLTELSIPWADPDLPPSHPDNVVTQESAQSLSEDGAIIVFQRTDGPENPQLGVVNQFYEARRPADAPPGTKFGAPALTGVPSTLVEPYPYPLFCPTISPDGRAMFFSSSYPDELDDGGSEFWGGALKVQVITRPNVDSPWGAIINTIPELSLGDWQTCPSGVTADGCHLVIHRFLL